MTFEELWREVEAQNSQIETGRVSMSSAGFKKAMRLAYEQGKKAADGEALFNGLFGKVKH